MLTMINGIIYVIDNKFKNKNKNKSFKYNSGLN